VGRNKMSRTATFDENAGMWFVFVFVCFGNLLLLSY
jgi:hypothetical protein